MAFSLEYKKTVYNAGFLFCGMGGGAAGFQDKETIAYFKGVSGTFRSVVAIDSDPLVCKAFEIITGNPAICRDLFSREQYEAFHRKKPPEGWSEATPEDIHKDCGGVAPDVWFTSAPCKGFSGLLPSKSALTGKYQALNRLTVRGLKLILEAFPREEDRPSAILFENVPRITTRGEDLLVEIKALLSSYGYLFHEGSHDCGEIGGLGQRRKRYLLIARNPKKLASFIYQPPKLRVKSIGEVIGPLPMPDDPSCGPMHRLPRLQWKTWVRLGLIPAGGDWRDLEKIAQERYRLEYIPRGGGAFGVQEWDKPGSSVIGNASVKGSNAVSVADIRLPENENKHGNCYRVVKFEDPSPCVVGSRFGSGAPAMADPRLYPKSPKFSHAYKIIPFDEPASTVASGGGPSCGAACIADARHPLLQGEGQGEDGSRKQNRHHSHFRVTPFDEPAGTVTGADHVANGAPNVADPRLNLDPANYNGSPGLYGVNDWEKPAPVITGGAKVSSSNTPAAIADPRMSCKLRPGYMGVIPFDEPAPAVTGSGHPTSSNTPASVADPRYFDNAYGVQEFDKPSGAVTGGKSPSCGDKCIADPRVKFEHNSKKTGPFAIGKWSEPINTITGSTGVNEKCGIAAVDDPRMTCKPRAGTMEVQDWNKSSDAVVGTANVHAGGASAVADPRIPEDNERPDPVPVIISLDNTWHRPLTTLELAVLQSFNPFLPDGRPLVLPGNSDGKWREMIGNAVPPATACEIAKQILVALLMNGKQEFMLHSEPVWVRQPEELPEHIFTVYSDDRHPDLIGKKG